MERFSPGITADELNAMTVANCSALADLQAKMGSYGSEEEWQQAVSASHCALLHGLANLYTKCRMVSGVELAALSAANQLQVGILFLWTSLHPRFYSAELVDNHPTLLPQLGLSLLQDVADVDSSEELIMPRMHLLATLLMHTPHNILSATVGAAQAEGLMTVQLRLLASGHTLLYDMACRNLLLLNGLHGEALLRLCSDSAHSRGFSERLAQLYNRPFDDEEVEAHVDAALLAATLSFLKEIFSQGKPQTFFYTNDVYVLFDVTVRRINDSQKTDLLLGQELELLTILLQSNEIRDAHYKMDAVVTLMNELVENFSTGSNLLVARKIAECADTVRALGGTIQSPKQEIGVQEDEEEHEEEESKEETQGMQNKPPPPPPGPRPSSSRLLDEQRDQARRAPAPPARPPPLGPRPSSRACPPTATVTPPTPPPRPRAAEMMQAVAMYPFTGGVRGDGELLFSAGTIIVVVRADDNGWLFGFKKAHPTVQGFFPESYVQTINT